jgi:predicted AAA+ superfamily ATPase
MWRAALDGLLEWIGEPNRRPLVLRGARQVGKTWLIRELARQSGLRLVEINFERNPEMAGYFVASDPREVLAELSLALDVQIEPSRCLLFLDEVQASAEVLAKLRWFAEEMAELVVVAAGSLLDFVLSDHRFSMPVGRIQYAYLEPMSFIEYLRAHNQDVLGQNLLQWRPGEELSAATKAGAAKWFARYLMVGGMPAVVQLDTEGAAARVCRRRQEDLLATYRDDFAKYAARIDRQVLDLVLQAVVASLGQKFVYARVGEGVKQHQAKAALELLEMSRLVTLVRYTSANGLPLAAQVNERYRKALLLDIGLAHAMLKTPAQDQFPAWKSLNPQLRGQLIEQLCGQQLRALETDPRTVTPLFYWQRQGGRAGELDYLLQLGTSIVPVEIKAGSAGAMKSLHQFMHDKQLALAVRFDENAPSVGEVELKTTQGDRVRYQLLSLPHYSAASLAQIVARL